MAERPTPHSICICILIALYSDKSSPIYNISSVITDDKKKEEVEDYLSQVLIDFVVSNPEGWRTNNNNNQNKNETIINHEKTTFPIMSLTELCHFISGNNNGNEEEWKEEMIHVWIQDLKDTCASLNHFLDLFVALEQQTLIDKESILGIYIRQRCLGFHTLSFEASCQLYTCFCQHVQQSTTTNQTINHHHWPNSSQQVSRQLQQIISLSSKNQDEKEEENHDDDIYYYYKDYPELPLYHYLLFLFQQKRKKNHEEAMNQYHRYFDYGMIHQRKQRVLTGGKDDNTNMFAYASIVLAYYYYYLQQHQQQSNNNDEMIQLAIQEAIRVSQQTSNDTCLSFAITYLHYFQNQSKNKSSFLPTSSSPSTNASSLMHHIHLLSSQQATTTTAKTIQHSHYPAASHPSWQYLAAAMTMNTTTAASTTATILTDDGGDDDVLLLQNNPTNTGLTSTSLAKQLRIGLWEYFGHVNLSTFYTMLSNDNHTKYVSEKQSMGIFYGSSTQRLQSKTNLRLQLQQTLLQPQPKQPSSSSLFDPQQSYYQKALDSIAKDSNEQKLHSRFVTSLQLEWSLQRTEIQKALIHQFHLHNYHVPQQQTQSFLQTWNYTSQLLAKSGNLEDAYITFERKIASIKGNDSHDYVYQVEYTLQLIIILIRDGNLELYHMILIPMLMECLNICERYSLHTWHSCALCLLGTVHYELGNIQDAMTILESTVPKLEQNAHVQYKQMAHFSLAKCHLKLSSTNSSNYRYKQCLHHLQVCETVLEKIQEYQVLKEVFYLQAQCYQSLLMNTTTTQPQKQAYKRMRNQAAKNFSLLQTYSVSAKYNNNNNII